MIIYLQRDPTYNKPRPGYYVLSESLYYNKNLKRRQKKNMGGPYLSLQQAKKRLKAVEAFKHMGKR